jgi:hypothetical protein
MASSRDNLRRVRVFFVVVVVIGLVQAVAAAVIASSADDMAATGVQVAVAAGVALIGASTVAARNSFLRRPWNTESPGAVAVGYSVRVVIQLILALGAANVAFAGAIVTGAAWIVVLGLVFFVAPLLAAAPTARNLARTQAALDEAGCRFDLVDSLRSADTV